MKCNHNDVTFSGWSSLIGGYKCNDCEIEIDQVVYHMIKKYPHVLFDQENKEKLQIYLSKLDIKQIQLLK